MADLFYTIQSNYYVLAAEIIWNTLDRPHTPTYTLISPSRANTYAESFSLVQWQQFFFKHRCQLPSAVQIPPQDLFLLLKMMNSLERNWSFFNLRALYHHFAYIRHLRQLTDRFKINMLSPLYASGDGKSFFPTCVIVSNIGAGDTWGMQIRSLWCSGCSVATTRVASPRKIAVLDISCRTKSQC